MGWPFYLIINQRVLSSPRDFIVHYFDYSTILSSLRDWGEAVILICISYPHLI